MLLIYIMYVYPGHLRLVHSLLTCENIDVNRHASLIHLLLDDFLFPAAKLELSADAHDSLCDFAPKYEFFYCSDHIFPLFSRKCGKNKKLNQKVCFFLDFD